MPRTTGFYAEIDVTAIRDGGNLKLEIANLDEVIVAESALAVQDGKAIIDIPQSVSQTWPDNAKFRLTAVTEAGRISSKFMSVDGYDEFVRRSTVPEPPRLDDCGTTLSGTSHTFTFTDTEGAAGRRYDLFINGVDQTQSVEYPATSWPEIAGLPSDGSVLTLQLAYWDDPADVKTTSCTVTAFSSGFTFALDPEVVPGSLKHNQVKIGSAATDYCQCRTETREPGGSWIVRKDETSTTWGPALNGARYGHQQTLILPNPSTTYDVRQTFTDADNNTVQRTMLALFTTPAAPVVAPPAVTSKLPSGGLFVGPEGCGGYKTGNGTISNEMMFQLRVPHSGNLINFGTHKRFPVFGEGVYVPGRPLQSGKFRARCGDNRLQQGACGIYTRSYAMGNGGTLTARVYPMQSDGVPDMSNLLAESAAFNPQSFADYNFWESPFLAGVNVAAGDMICIVFTNSTPIPRQYLSGRLYNESNGVSTAMNLDAQGVGAISPNGLEQYYTVNGPSRGPLHGDDGAKAFYRHSPTDPWTHNRGQGSLVPFFFLEFEDGAIHGNCWDKLSNKTGHARTIDGNSIARQYFNIEENVTVDGVWVPFGLEASANGQPLTVTLKSSAGATLATAQIASDLELKQRVIDAPNASFESRRFFQAAAQSWDYADFSNAVSFSVGDAPYVELTSPSGAGFRLNTYHRHGSAKFATDITAIPDGTYASYSSNGGSSFGAFLAGDAGASTHIMMTKQGFPKEYGT